MIVYCVVWVDYDGGGLVGVYSTQALAEGRLRHQQTHDKTIPADWYSIEEHEVDEPWKRSS